MAERGKIDELVQVFKDDYHERRDFHRGLLTKLGDWHNRIKRVNPETVSLFKVFKQITPAQVSAYKKYVHKLRYALEVSVKNKDYLESIDYPFAFSKLDYAKQMSLAGLSIFSYAGLISLDAISNLTIAKPLGMIAKYRECNGCEHARMRRGRYICILSDCPKYTAADVLLPSLKLKDEVRENFMRGGVYLFDTISSKATCLYRVSQGIVQCFTDKEVSLDVFEKVAVKYKLGVEQVVNRARAGVTSTLNLTNDILTQYGLSLD